MEKINIVTNLNGIDIFLEYNWLVKHNPEFNWDNGKIQFTRCLKECKIQHQDIAFTSRTKRLKILEETDNRHQKIGKELDLTNPKDLLEYIQLFTHLFNKKKFKKLLKRQ